MSIYSTTTESNINKPMLNDDLNYKKLQKFNKFYLTKNIFSSKDKTNLVTPRNLDKLFNKDIPMTPRTSLVKTNINNIHSRNYSNQKTLTKYKTYNNYNRMIRLFNPEILDGQYVSQPKKNKSKHCKIEIPKYQTFLKNKIKGKPLGLKLSNCITGNLSKFVIPQKYNNLFSNKSITNLKIKEKIKYKRDDPIKNAKIMQDKKHRKTVSNLLLKFKHKLNFDKRENLIEYNKFMSSLKINLDMTKSSRNTSNKFVYE